MRATRGSPQYHISEVYLTFSFFLRDETDLIGQDGHIYKGRFDGFDRMPDLPQVQVVIFW